MNPETNDYAFAVDYPDMVGKRARILPVEHYCSYIHGATGTIKVVYDFLFLQSDVPHNNMSGSYLTADAYELI